MIKWLLLLIGLSLCSIATTVVIQAMLPPQTAYQRFHNHAVADYTHIKTSITQMKLDPLTIHGRALFAQFAQANNFPPPNSRESVYEKSHDLYNGYYHIERYLICNLTESFTPEQIQLMRKYRSLPYERLTSEQRKIAALLYKNDMGKYFQETDFPKTSFVLLDRPDSGNHGMLEFRWDFVTPAGDNPSINIEF